MQQLKRRLWLLIALCWGADYGVLGFPANEIRAQAPLGTPPPTLPGDDELLLPEERVNIAVYENCNRSVVHIATRSVATESYRQLALREGSGSGSVLDANGLILTNQHVIDGAKQISVSLFNGISYQAVLVGQDPDTDIAILKIDAPADQLHPVTWGDSQKLRVGQKIYAIGNPFGLERTMSTGMISSLNRQIPTRTQRTMQSIIQVDAALNHGNSGGPLLNTRPANRYDDGDYEQRWGRRWGWLCDTSQHATANRTKANSEWTSDTAINWYHASIRERCRPFDRQCSQWRAS